MVESLRFRFFIITEIEKLRHSPGRPSRSDFAQFEFLEAKPYEKELIRNDFRRIVGIIPNFFFRA